MNGVEPSPQTFQACMPTINTSADNIITLLSVAAYSPCMTCALPAHAPSPVCPLHVYGLQPSSACICPLSSVLSCTMPVHVPCPAWLQHTPSISLHLCVLCAVRPRSSHLPRTPRMLRAHITTPCSSVRGGVHHSLPRSLHSSVRLACTIS